VSEDQGLPIAHAAEDQLPDTMAGLQPARVTAKLVPVFTPEDLTRLEQAWAGRSFAQRRDTAIIAAFTAAGIRLSELAGLRCSDVDLWQREITVRGKGGKDRIVKIGHQAARTLDRYLRARSRHAHAAARADPARLAGRHDTTEATRWASRSMDRPFTILGLTSWS